MVVEEDEGEGGRFFLSLSLRGGGIAMSSSSDDAMSSSSDDTINVFLF